MTYDYVIVGASLTGLLIAKNLSSAGASVCLLEGAETLGGLSRGQHIKGHSCNNGLRFIPGTELGLKAVQFLQKNLSGFDFHQVETNPQILESGSFQNFMGFGDSAPAQYEELSYFLSPYEIKTNLSVYQWIEQLQVSIGWEPFTRQFVTKFQTEDGKIHSCTVNGQKKIQAHNFIFCGNPSDLGLLLDANLLGPKATTKLNKSPFLTAICLDIFNPQFSPQDENIKIIHSVGQEESNTTLGRFQNYSEGLQISQWLTLIPSLDAEDTEMIGGCLRRMKRQIKRAYAQLFDSPATERIMVAPKFAGADLKLTASRSLPGVANLWIASPQLHSQKNILGGLLSAELILAALGFQPSNDSAGIGEPALDLAGEEAQASMEENHLSQPSF